MERQRDERPEYRPCMSGGICGKPFKLSILGPEGEREVPQGEAHQEHTNIMNRVKGPDREAYIAALYQRLGEQAT